jgi:hypothetical protein
MCLAAFAAGASNLLSPPPNVYYSSPPNVYYSPPPNVYYSSPLLSNVAPSAAMTDTTLTVAGVFWVMVCAISTAAYLLLM